MDQQEINDLHGQSLHELLTTSQQQSALLVALTARLEQIDQNQDAVQQALAVVQPPQPQRPRDPRTGDEVGRSVAPVKLRPMPEVAKKQENVSFNAAEIEVRRPLKAP